MPNICRNTLRFIGTHEAVAEVAMHLCQAHHVQVFGGAEQRAFLELGPEYGLRLPREVDPVAWNVESFGTRTVDEPEGAPRFVALLLDARTAWGPSDELLQTLSQRFPDVVVGDVYAEGMNDIWGVKVLLNGEALLDCEADAAPVDETWQSRYDDADDDEAQKLIEELDDARDLWGLNRLREVAIDALNARHAERSTSIPEPLRQHGWPRWSLLAHAANAEGFDGLKVAMPATTAEEMTASFASEAKDATRLGVASWLDTSLFGDAAEALPLESDLNLQIGGSYAVLSIDGFRDRHLRLLAAVARAKHAGPDAEPLAHALHASLSDPESRLGCELHPAVFLTVSAASALEDDQLPSASAVGLEMVLASLASRMPRLESVGSLGEFMAEGQRVAASDPMLRSVLALVALQSAAPSQMKIAVAAGVNPRFILRTLLVPRDGPANQTVALERLADTFGGYSKFPASLVDEATKVGGDFAAAYRALVTAEQMRESITSSASAKATEVAPRRAARI